METNSFKLLEEEDEKLHPPPPDLEQSVLGSLQVLQMMGLAMELYIPKALEMFLLTMQGTLGELDRKASSLQEDNSPQKAEDSINPFNAGPGKE